MRVLLQMIVATLLTAYLTGCARPIMLNGKVVALSQVKVLRFTTSNPKNWDASNQTVLVRDRQGHAGSILYNYRPALIRKDDGTYWFVVDYSIYNKTRSPDADERIGVWLQEAGGSTLPGGKHAHYVGRRGCTEGGARPVSPFAIQIEPRLFDISDKVLVIVNDITGKQLPC